jgi:hypothetical protein
MSNELAVDAGDLLIDVVLWRIAQDFPVRCKSRSSDSLLVVLIGLMNTMFDWFFCFLFFADSEQAIRRVNH